jgi:hypothetical protein
MEQERHLGLGNIAFNFGNGLHYKLEFEKMTQRGIKGEISVRIRIPIIPRNTGMV